MRSRDSCPGERAAQGISLVFMVTLKRRKRMCMSRADWHIFCTKQTTYSDNIEDTSRAYRDEAWVMKGGSRDTAKCYD